MKILITLPSREEKNWINGNVPPKVTVESRYHKFYGASSKAPLYILITFTVDVSVGLLAAWLYDKLKNYRSQDIRIDRKEIEINEGEIRRIIIEKIEKKS